jgi:hypothetical protein
VAAVVALLLLVFAWPDQFVTRVLLLLVAGAGVMAVVRGVRGVREPSRGRRPAV